MTATTKLGGVLIIVGILWLILTIVAGGNVLWLIIDLCVAFILIVSGAVIRGLGKGNEQRERQTELLEEMVDKTDDALTNTINRILDEREREKG